MKLHPRSTKKGFCEPVYFVIFYHMNMSWQVLYIQPMIFRFFTFLAMKWGVGYAQSLLRPSKAFSIAFCNLNHISDNVRQFRSKGFFYIWTKYVPVIREFRFYRGKGKSSCSRVVVYMSDSMKTMRWAS